MIDEAYIEGHIDSLQRAILVQGEAIDHIINKIILIEKKIKVLELYQAEGWTL